MKAEQKLAHQRLSVLELAEALGDVSEACRRRGISRTQFYEYKSRFQTHGIEGLLGLPSACRSLWAQGPLALALRLKGL